MISLFTDFKRYFLVTICCAIICCPQFLSAKEVKKTSTKTVTKLDNSKKVKSSQPSKNNPPKPNNKNTTSSKTEQKPNKIKANEEQKIEQKAETPKPETTILNSHQIYEQSEESLSHVKDNQFMSKKLWRELSNRDFTNIRKIADLLSNGNYNEAVNFVDFEDAKEVSDLNKKNITKDSNGSTLVKEYGANPSFHDALNSIILWKKYSDKNLKNTSFNDVSRFIADNSFYPNIVELKKSAEKLATQNNVPYQYSAQYFKYNPAISLESKLYLLRAEIDYLQRFQGSKEERENFENDIRKFIVDIWVKENFSLAQEEWFLSNFKSQLTETNHVARIDRLLWEQRIEEAKRILQFVDEDYQKLFLAIIELNNSPKYIENIILSVPRKLRDSEGLSYQKLLWYKSHDEVDKIIEIFVNLPQNLQYANRWWPVRKLYLREMLKQKKYKFAYAIAAKHSLPTTSSDYWEAEWTAGWIALRFLDEPKAAYQHFEKVYKNVVQPVTISRAAYWLAMASYSMKDNDRAIDWYKVAAKYPTFFYGQLAIHKHRMINSLDAEKEMILPKSPNIADVDIKDAATVKSLQIAYLLSLMGDMVTAGKVFENFIINAKSDGQIAIAMKLINEIDNKELSAKMSRVASRRNVFFISDKFQIVKQVESSEYAPLIHAIIKQESGFAPSAVSKVGALGYMQIMPDTAKLLAKNIGVKYDKRLLATDIDYNVRLGSHYIKELVDKFNGSEIMAIASYNAGPNAAQRWVNEFYDPRREADIDRVVDWIELITYSETRNYVQRVLENMIVYKYLMSRQNYDSVK